jgi:hypothetical protein
MVALKPNVDDSPGRPSLLNMAVVHFDFLLLLLLLVLTSDSEWKRISVIQSSGYEISKD